MSGEEKSAISIQERLKQVDNEIDELYNKYEIKKDMFVVNVNMGEQECKQNALDMSARCYLIQLESNRLKAKYNYLQTNLNALVYKEQGNYSGSWESQYWKAINGNSACKEFRKIMTGIQIHLDAIEYITKRIETHIDLLKDIARGKKI